MKRRRATLLAAGACVALAGVAGVVWAVRSPAMPLRCGDGLVPMGSRCCAPGQRLDSGRCSGEPSSCPAPLLRLANGCAPPRDARVRLNGGRLKIGPSDWEAQGVVSAREADVMAFSIDVFEVTESRWEACAAERACPARPSSGEPGRAVAGVTLTEARSFCSWAGGRLPTPDELAWAAAGAGARRYAWGDTGAVCRRAAWGSRDGPCASGSTGPEIAGSHPDGASPEGVYDLAGNVAEWAVDAQTGAGEVRGGSWSDGAVASLRSWSRRVPAPEARQDDVGLRCVYDDR